MANPESPSPLTKSFGEGFKALIMAILTLSVVGSYLYMGYLIMTGHVGSADPQVAQQQGQYMGNLQGFAAGIIAYHFGSTLFSKDKDKTISAMANKETTNT